MYAIIQTLPLSLVEIEDKCAARESHLELE